VTDPVLANHGSTVTDHLVDTIAASIQDTDEICMTDNVVMAFSASAALDTHAHDSVMAIRTAHDVTGVAMETLEIVVIGTVHANGVTLVHQTSWVNVVVAFVGNQDAMVVLETAAITPTSSAVMDWNAVTTWRLEAAFARIHIMKVVNSETNAIVLAVADMVWCAASALMTMSTDAVVHVLSLDTKDNNVDMV